MSLGRTPDTKHLFHSSEELCAALVPPGSLYAVLFRESRRLFPDDAFADLYGVRGRPSVPPRILAANRRFSTFRRIRIARTRCSSAQGESKLDARRLLK